MTWARLDDGITDRPDLLALERTVRLLHIEGIVWSCRHETDGAIPRHVIRKVTDDPDPEAAAAALVAAGLWNETDDGWCIDGFLEDQISSEDLERQRELARVRQRRQRQHRAGDHSLCEPRYCRRASEASRVTDPVTDPVSHDSPTSPDPTRPTGRKGKGQGLRGGSSEAPRDAPLEEGESQPNCNCDGTGWVNDDTVCAVHRGVAA